MRKYIFAAAAAVMSVAAASAAVTAPQFYYEDFSGMYADHTSPAEGWMTYGNGAAPDATMSNFFNPSGTGPYYIFIQYGSQVIPFSCTNFEPAAAADEWLVTPEIDIPSDNVELSFTAAVYCNRGTWGLGKNPYKILISETGSADKSDFSDVPVFEGTVNGSRTAEIATKDVVCPLNGFGGKKVRLAFVSTGENLGMTGFTNIGLGNYAITLDNKTPKVTEEGNELTVSVNVGLKTPVPCPGIKATLEIAGGTQDKEFKKPFGNTGNALIYQLVKFDPITVVGTETLTYSVTLTPDYEGAPATVLTGSVGVPTVTYPANVVVEEVTATGCQACPSGTASLQYYHATYPGSETEGKVIGIAVHGFINYTDPMAAGVNDYLAHILDLNGTTSYPQAMFNRATRGLTPDRKTEVEKQIAEGSYNKVEIKGVSTTATEENPWGAPVTVMYDAYNAYDAESLNLAVAAVMIENNVRGNESGYDQTNGFYNRSEDYIRINYGEFLVPYMKPYLSGGEFGTSRISFREMVYNHVARGIWPSFSGEIIDGAWTRGVARDGKVEFDIPENIHNLSDTEIVVLLIDADTQAIVASDIIAAEDYNKNDSVSGVALDGVKAERHGDIVAVVAPAGSFAEVYTPAGVRIARVAVAGEAKITVPAGIMLVRVTTPVGSAAYKLAD